MTVSFPPRSKALVSTKMSMALQTWRLYRQKCLWRYKLGGLGLGSPDAAFDNNNSRKASCQVRPSGKARAGKSGSTAYNILRATVPPSFSRDSRRNVSLLRCAQTTFLCHTTRASWCPPSFLQLRRFRASFGARTYVRTCVGRGQSFAPKLSPPQSLPASERRVEPHIFFFFCHTCNRPVHHWLPTPLVVTRDLPISPRFSPLFFIATQVLWHLVNQWSNFAYSRSHAFRCGNQKKKC